MPSPKNLIAIKQIRQDELSGFALTVASGYVQSYVSGVTGQLLSYINLVSGNLQNYTDTASGTLQDGLDDLQTQIDGLGISLLSFNVPLSAGVDTVHVLYGQSVSNSVAVVSVGSSGVADPLLISMLTTRNATGQAIALSQTTSTSNYYLNLLVPV